MINVEIMLVISISRRFRKIRGSTPIDTFAPQQKSSIYAIEKMQRPKSGNFVSDLVLDCYAEFFKLSKQELIFGSDEEIEKMIYSLFDEIGTSIVFKEKEASLEAVPSNDSVGEKVKKAILQLYYTFADFGRWYDLRKGSGEDEEEFPIDFESMLRILWLICQEKLIRSFKETVIAQSFNEQDQKFYFNRINEKVQRWLEHEVSELIIPEVVEKLKQNSIFKIGFMVKALITEFLVTDLPESYLEEIPIDEFIPPIKRFIFKSSKVGADIEEEARDFADRIVEFQIRMAQRNRGTIEDYEEMENDHPFDGFESITDESTPFLHGTRKVSVNDFIDHIVNIPPFMNEYHILNHREQKVPGILSVNLQATNIFQERVNESVIEMIDNLVGIQNLFITFIKWEELKTFAK